MITIKEHTACYAALGVCLAIVGGAFTAARAKPEQTTAPEPGTRDYYEQKIKGSYAFHQGELVSFKYALKEGRVLQVLSNDLVVIGQTVTNASGVLTYPLSGIVTLVHTRGLKKGEPFRMLVGPDVSFYCQSLSTNGSPGALISRTAYREVAEPTYEEYRQAFERDLQKPGSAPIVFFERATPQLLSRPIQLSALGSRRTLPPGLSRLPNSPAVPFYTTTNHAVTLVRHHSVIGEVSVTNEVNGLPVVAIGPGAFQNCEKITAIVLPDTLTSIGSQTFRNCTGLTRVTIPASVTRIDENVFWDCPALESILVSALNPVYSSSADGVLFNADKTQLIRCPQGKKGGYSIPSRVTRIKGWAFRDCVGLTAITLPNSVTDIEGGVFWNCTGLTSLAIPASVTRLDAWAFSGCSRLETISVDEANPVFCNGTGGVVLNKERTKLVRYPSGKKGDYPNPVSTKEIGGGAFEGSAGLTSVTIPEGMTEIGGFKNCCSLTNVVIPASVTRICGEAFSHCYSLTDITLPDKLAELHGFSFWDCTNLTSIVIPGSLSRIEGSTFQGCGNLKDVTIRNGVSSIGGHAFAWCGMSRITIPASVTNIAGCAFRGCRALSEVYFEGDAPGGAADTSIFCDGTANVTVYSRRGAKGWGETFGGRPTAVQ